MSTKKKTKTNQKMILKSRKKNIKMKNLQNKLHNDNILCYFLLWKRKSLENERNGSRGWLQRQDRSQEQPNHIDQRTRRSQAVHASSYRSDSAETSTHHSAAIRCRAALESVSLSRFFFFVFFFVGGDSRDDGCWSNSPQSY